MFNFHNETDWENGKHFKHHCKVFMNVIGSAIKTADKPDLLTYHLEFVGSRHIGGGITEFHFNQLHDIFIESMEFFLSDKNKWSPDLRDAWSEIYSTMATVILSSMNRKI